MKRRGVLIVNLGTPAAATPESVAVYLREFLMDPLVVDLPLPLRWLVVHGLIVPRRSRRSAELYGKIWTEAGSPLLCHTLELVRALGCKLGPGYRVHAAMRYGAPSFTDALVALRHEGVEDVVVFPQYPQYALSTFESARREVSRAAQELHPDAQLSFVPPFFSDESFLDAYASELEETTRAAAPDHYVFSFHGLPARHVKKADPSGKHCLRFRDCCSALSAINSNCYRAQCFWTAREIARRSGVEDGRYTVAFQSRMPGAPWIRPYSDEVLRELAARGARRVAVCTPSFTVDCLETLEEIGIRYRNLFRGLGGEELHLVPSLNARPNWVAALANIVAREGPSRSNARHAQPRRWARERDAPLGDDGE